MPVGILELNSRLPLLLYTIIPDFFFFLVEIQPVIGIRIFRESPQGKYCHLPPPFPCPPPKKIFIVHILLKEPFIYIQSKCKWVLMTYA